MTRSLAPLLLVACGGAVPTLDFVPPAAAPVDLDAPGPIVHEAVVSARWAVPLEGLVDLDDARAAELSPGEHDIVLPVHVLTHPTAGVFVIDTGVPRADSPARGLIARFAGAIEPVEPLGAILDRQEGPLTSVFLTHAHLDHVLGLVDVPEGVSIHAGRGEEAPANFEGRLTFPTFARALGDRTLTTWNFDASGLDVGGVRAIDVLGDGSLYALDANGHTPGSTAYLARTTEGPALFTGDCSHTRWGWDHGVTPGTYTVDHEANAHSLAALRGLAADHPSMQVFVGHEL